VYQDFNYIADPHTACGFKALAKDRPSIVLATASPAKFPDTIIKAIGIEPIDPSLEALKQKPLAKHKLPATSAAIRAYLDAHAV
jgi:threonine synthase